MSGQALCPSTPTGERPAAVPSCVNLMERYGDEYKITWDPAYDAKGKHRRNRDPWYMQIPCKGRVTLYPHGRTLLAAEVNHHPSVVKKLLAIPGVVLSRDGDGEQTLLFDVNLFPQVATVVRPRRRKRLPPEQRQACAERLARGRQSSARSDDGSGLEGVQTVNPGHRPPAVGRNRPGLPGPRDPSSAPR